MIDLHCHLLPGIDDGPRSVENAVALAKACTDDGITQAVVTPHVFAGRWDNKRTSIRAELKLFQEQLHQADVPLQLMAGGEVHLLAESLALLAANELPFIGGWGARKVVLLEMPDGNIPSGAMRSVEFFLKHDVVPMIAHPERNKDVMRNPDSIKPFVQAGCILQVTAASVCNRFGKAAFRTAQRLLDDELVSVVATDTHNLAHRPPMMTQAHQALTASFGEHAAQELTLNNPRRIVNARPALGIAD